VVIYEMLTGELPIGRFAAPSAKVEIDVRLDEVVLRTLEKEPQHRYQRASQIKSDMQSIASTDNPAFVKTLVAGADAVVNDPVKPASLQQQELAGRMLLTRRELMDRVKGSLRPLFRGQIVQILIGVAIIILGAQCWARNTSIPHRLVSGVILHLYGIFVIASAAAVCTRIKRIDYSNPVVDIRDKLGRLQALYLRVGPGLGLPWWLLWIPACVAIGFDAVLHPSSLVVSLIVGVVGLAVSLWLYWLAVRPGTASSESRRQKLSGGSISAAYLALEEIENAQIR
ncbi:MAG: serine/threonine protein kinase, partial [Rubripirellula sp.]